MNIAHALAIGGMVLVFTWPVSRVVAADAQAGKVVYDKNCAGCHGADGKGNPAMIKALGEKGLNIVTKETTQKSDEQILKIIAEGSGKMPASKKLSKEEQKQVLDYSRSLAK
jgi:mono/diheme cytochrome c family protein